MGFEVNRFPDQQVPTHLLCFLCNKVFDKPLQAPECEHSFCSSCIHQWLNSTAVCPHLGQEEDNISVKSDTKKKSPLRKMSFRKIMGKSNKDSGKEPKLPQLRSEDLKQLPDNVLEALNALKITCDYAAHGCTSVVTLVDLPSHLAQCTHAPVEQSTLSTTSQSATTTTPTTASTTETTTTTTENATTPEVESKSSDELSPVVKDTNAGTDADGSECTGSDSSKSRKGSCVSEDREEVGSDDFVVVPKNAKDHDSVGESTSDKTQSGDLSDEKNTEKKKKKKNKKKNAKKDEDSTGSQELNAGKGLGLGGLSQTHVPAGEHSKSGTVVSTGTGISTGIGICSDVMMLKRIDILQQAIDELREEKQRDDAKFEHLRSVNQQLVLQIKQMHDEAQQQQHARPDQKQLDDLQEQLKALKQQNEKQQAQIQSLSSINSQYIQLITSMRQQELKAKDHFAHTVSQFNQILNTIRAVKA